jgi:hypothetical protein
MNKVSLCLALAAAALLAGPASARPGAAGSPSLEGSGCASSSDTTARVLGSGKDGLPEQISIRFSRHVAQHSAGFSSVRRQSGCTIVLVVHAPAGKQFGIAGARYQGYAALPDGATAQQQSELAFGSSQAASLRSSLSGPFRASFDREVSLKPEELAWSPCEASVPLTIRTELRLTVTSAASATVRMARQTYRLAWRSCAP